ELTLLLNNGGVKAVGISGKDGGWLKATKKMHKDGDIGHVGDVAITDPTLINLLISGGYIPVISPIGFDGAGNTFNLNADDVAAAVAAAVGAEKLVLMTDVNGIYRNYPDPSSFISKIDLTEAKALLNEVKGGMIPKLTCAITAIESGVHTVHLLNGSTPHSLLIEVFSDSGIGTMIQK
ncbi:MAG: acetylglutamate kinase, partial [Erysipelotrichaceae bacterium]|nr:acetylglutamate kinase [Erysipelotrichaceae bacterium]